VKKKHWLQSKQASQNKVGNHKMISGTRYLQIIKPLLKFLITILLPACYSVSIAQVSNPYQINGNAYQDNCNCYTLTNNDFNLVGAVWNEFKIDLTQPFDYYFNVYLGCEDSIGADGIVFALQTSLSSIGTNGEGMGFGGISPSIGVTIDTYPNGDDDDPSYDHIAIQANGDPRHQSANNLAGPVTALAGSNNIKDCQWHILHVSWDPVALNLSAQVDGVNRVSANIDLINQIFGGNANVYWGFTGSTGGSRDLQKFCTALNSYYSFPSQKTCYPAAVQFVDSSVAFGKILKWYWNFGDGTVDSVDQNPPLHSYPAPGDYTATLTILGNNGCLSDTFSQQIILGSKPVAGFGFSAMDCSGASVVFTDSSFVQYGSIDQWNWSNTSGTLNLDTTQGGLVRVFPPGPETIQLVVDTKQGCTSDTTEHSFLVNPRPTTSITVSDVCFGQPALFSAANTDPSVPITQWYWLPGDGTLDSSANVQHLYAKAGQYQVSVFATNDECHSDTLTAQLTVYQTDAFAGRDTIVAKNEPLQLHATGGEYYEWSPPTGLNDPSIADPVAILQNDQTYTLTVSSPIGCATTDTIQIKVYKGPAFYVPNAFTPNNDGRNDRFRVIAVGMASIYFFNIYNRYGQLIYSSTDTKEGWDGTFQGKAQPTGTFVWMVKGIDYNGVIHAAKGTVTLIR
jgi:gliding motility-associated-like protein